MLRVLLVEDERIPAYNLQQGLRRLGYDVPSIAPSGSKALELIERDKPDIVLMDIQMPGINGIEAVRQLKQELPNVQILIQTVFEDEDRIFESIQAGASGYILKSCLNQSLLTAIKELQSGGAPMTPLVARKLMNMIYQSKTGYPQRSKAVDYNLTTKEKEVLASIVNGLSYKMIASELHISYETVRSHVKKIYEKLHVASLTEVVAKAINQQIV